MSADPEPAPPAVSVAAAPSTAVFVPMNEDQLPQESVEEMSPDSAPQTAEPAVDEDDLSHEDNDDLDNLTPPPDSPSPVPSIPTASNNLQDEIVVGTKANGTKASPAPVVSDQEDAEMEDADDQPTASHYPKRKRNSLYSSLNEDSKEPSTPSAAVPSEDPIMHASKRTHGTNQVRGVTLGYWRDSQVPDKADKHAVIGFIDVRDRLRTRIQQVSRTGKLVVDRYPLPPGPGGSWVTFERIVFEEHLVYLDHHQVKEYVKVRVDTWGTEKTEDEVQTNNAEAVKEAMARVSAKPAPDTGLAPAIAYGESIPEQVKQNSLHEKKKRRLNSSFIGAGQSPPAIPGPLDGHELPMPGPRIVSRAPRMSVVDDLPGTRPTRILVGYWGNSSAEEALDKHAVIGVLGTNDMFRVKLTRQTRDGRAIFGNFPQGPGALWISYEDVVFEPHLRDLSRSEIKEYCRVRQHQLDRLGGKEETPEERIANETKAVYDAQLRVAAGPNPQSGSGSMAAVTEAVVMAHREKLRTEEADQERRAELQRLEAQERAAREMVSDDNYDDDGGPDFSPDRSFNGHDLRQARRGASSALKEATRPARHSLPNSSDLRAAHRPSNSGPADSSDRLERVDSIARQSIARAEAHQSRIDQRNNRASSLSREGKAAAFSDNMKTLNRVWQSQESHRMRSGSSSAAGGVTDDSKTYGGVKYERRQNGPFAGKLVSQGTIISIDGEDYVEYRVLTKPSFF